MTPAPGSPLSSARRADTRTSFSNLIERWQSQQHELDALAREAQALLERQQEEARDTADQLLIDARIEAARLLTEARREVAALGAEVESLRQAQREAAHALQQTRRALDAALGRMDASLEAGEARPAESHAGVSGRAEALPHETRSAEALPHDASRRAEVPPHDASLKAEALPRAGTPLGGSLVSSPARARGRALVAAAILGVLVVAGAAALFWTMARGRSDTRAPARETTASSAPIASASSAAVHPAATSNGVAAAASPAATAAPLTVVLEARRNAWVRATVDGSQEAGRTLAPGQTRRITAQREILVRAGDAGALFVTVNGGSKAPFGRDGEVRTRRFGEALAAPPAAVARPDTAPPAADTSSPVADTATPPAAVPAPAQAIRTSGIASAAPDPARPPSDPSPSPAGGAAGRAVTPGTTAMEQQILTNDRLWFDGFYRGDGAAMAQVAAPGFEVVDGRARNQKPAPGARPERILSDVRVDIHGDGAVLSGRMIERIAAHGAPVEHESFVSQVWVRRDGSWKLLGLRLASADQVRQAAGSLR